MAQEQFLDPPMPDIIAQWRVYLSLLRLRPGDRVLDVGCNRGDSERLLLTDYPELGLVVGLNKGSRNPAWETPPWTELAKRGRLAFLRGDAHRLPLGDASFDRVMCMETAEYFDEPVRALGEIRRVLTPDGIAVIEHTDWDTQVFNATDLARSRILTLAFGDSGPRGQIGRQLLGLCRAAGFESVDPLIYTLVNTEWEADHYAYRAVQMVRDWLLQKQLAEPEVLDAWQADLEAQARAGQFFYSVNRCICVCTK